MLRDEYFRRLIDGAHVELFLSGEDGARIYWPWRMQPPSNARKPLRNACEVFAVDSDPQDDTVTNEVVLDKAVELDAEIASLQDVYLDKDATVDSILHGLEVYDDHEFDGTLLLPLQAPHTECWLELGAPMNHWLGIGGLKDGTAKQRLAAASDLRATAGKEVHIHGFGWGVKGIASEIRRRPELLDSLDYSTPVQNTVTNDASPGAEVASVSAMMAATQLVRDLREVSVYPDVETTTQVPLL